MKRFCNELAIATGAVFETSLTQLWGFQAFVNGAVVKKPEVGGSAPLLCWAVTLGGGSRKLFEGMEGMFRKS